MKTPKKTALDRDDTHRLIPYRYSDRGKPVLNRLAQDDDDLLNDLTELEGATNDRLLGENGKLSGVSAVELVSGFALAHIVNAAFTHGQHCGFVNFMPEPHSWPMCGSPVSFEGLDFGI